MKFDFIDPYDLEKLTTYIFRPALTYGGKNPKGYGWKYDIYLDKNSGKYVVFDFIAKGKFLFFDELPSEDLEMTLSDVLAQYHADDNPAKRPVIIQFKH